LFAQRAARHGARGGRRQSLTRTDEIMIIDSERQGACHPPHAAALGADDQFGNLRIAAPTECATERGSARQQQGIRARLGGRYRGREAREAAADHQHIRARCRFFVTIGIGLTGSPAESRHAADGGFEQMPVGPFECLVVEPRRQQRRHGIIDGAEIESDTGPAIDTGRSQPIVKLHQGRTHIGGARGAFAHVNEAVGFLDAAGENAARPMQLETAPHELNPVRQ
jgi:hypothetical protein